MKNIKWLAVLLIVVLLLGVTPVYALDSYGANYTEWSEWSTTVPESKEGREIQTRDVTIGYNMVTYLTMTQQGVRQYRSYSVGGNYAAYGLKASYGEFHYSYYAAKAAIDAADTAAEGSYVNYASNTRGWNMGVGTACVGWGVQDCLVWFIESPVTQTEYRYRDVCVGPGPKSYEIVFCDWDGAVLSTQIVFEGKDAVPPADPSRAGYTFAGWSCSYKNVRQNLTVTALYQQDQPKSFRVFFDANGGSCSTQSIRVTNGEPYGDLPVPVYEGYSFEGWYTERSGGSRIRSDSVVSLNADLTLFAHWKKNAPASWTVRFDANGGSCSTQSIRVTNGEPYGDLPVPVYEGYSFEGWYTERSGGSRIRSDSVVSLNADLTLFAHWKAASYSFSVDALSYSFSNSAEAFGYPASYRIPLERFQLIYGNTALAKTLYQNEGTWGGSCYGMATSSGLFRSGGASPSGFRSGARHASQLSVNDRNGDWGLLLKEYIEAMQISWYSYGVTEAYWNNLNRLSGLCEAVAAYQYTGSDPVVICVYGEGYGHALVGCGLQSVSGTESRLYVYDCNYPMNSGRYITLSKDASGQYTAWHYDLNDRYHLSSSCSGGKITYIPYSVYLSVWNDRAGANGGMVNLTLNTASATVYDTGSAPVAVIENGCLVSANSGVYLIPSIGISSDCDAQERTTSSLWLPADHYIVENNDPSVQEFGVTLAELDQAVSVSTSAKSVAVEVSDSRMLSLAQIDEAGCSYEIALSSSLPGTYADVRLSGETQDAAIRISQRSGSIQAEGSPADGTILVNGEAVSLRSASSDPANGILPVNGEKVSPQSASADPDTDHEEALIVLALSFLGFFVIAAAVLAVLLSRQRKRSYQ